LIIIKLTVRPELVEGQIVKCLWFDKLTMNGFLGLVECNVEHF
jgi:hypothetical protein